MEREPNRGLISGAAVVLLFLGLARLIGAIIEGNAEGYLGGIVSAVALWAIAGMVFWLNRDEVHRVQRVTRNADIIPFERSRRSAARDARDDAA